MLADESVTSQDWDKEQHMVDEYKKSLVATEKKVNDYLKAKEIGHRITGEWDSAKTGQEGLAACRLPKISLAVYDGTCLDWLGWWSQFETIHENPGISEVDKFRYLMQSKKQGTQAERLVRSYPLTKENYPKVIKALKDHFGDSTILTEVYVRQLLKLVVNNIRRKGLSLESMYDQLESHLKSLDSLGVNVQQNAYFLYPMVESSLPEDLLRTSQRSALAGYDVEDGELPPTVDKRLTSLLKFMRKEVKREQRLGYIRDGLGESSGMRTNRHDVTRMHAVEVKNRHSGFQQQPRIKPKNSLEEKVENTSLEDKMVPVNEQEVAYTGMHVRTAIPKALLATALVRLMNDRGEGMVVRVLLDQGSQSSFIGRDLLQQLNTTVARTNAQVYGINETRGEVVRELASCRLESLTRPGWTIPVQALVVNKMTGMLPSQDLCLSISASWHSLPLADPQFERSRKIDMILGADVYGQLLFPDIIRQRQGQLCTQNTKLGWVISGKLPFVDQSSPHLVYHTSVKYEDGLEEIPIKRRSSTEEEFCERLYQSEVERTRTGRYVVPLPLDPTIAESDPGETGEFTGRQMLCFVAEQYDSGKDGLVRVATEIKDLESRNKSIVESKNIHRLKLFQQEVNERKISLNQIVNTLLESELDETQYEDYSKAKDDIFNMLVSIEEALSLIETKENTHSDKQLPESNVNLPKINLPIFNGDSANWLSFREIFNSTINSNQTLTEIQKFQYLNASVKGPAEKLIRGFPISDRNYQQAWDTLCNRFNNRRELAFSQINKIFSIRSLKSISTGSLYEILDVCNEGIRNLSVLGLEKNTLTDLILINFFEKRIGEALRKEWELTLQNEEYPTFENFVIFLEKHARSLQGMRIPLFINLPLPKKWELVKKHKLCQNCLRANHEISKCLITSRCKNCKQNHHTLLHEYNSEPSIPQPTTSQEMLISTNTICNVMPLETETNILLSTALIKVKAKDGSFVLCRALVDNGSQICLISEQCCHKLGLEKMKNSYTLKGVGDIVVNRTTSQVEIEFTPHHNDQLFSARAFVVGRVTADLPNFQIQSADFPHLENLLLADPEFYVTKPIDLILGADTFVEIILGHKTDLKHHPIALNTKLGWLVSGRIHSNIKSNTSVINHCTTELDSSIRKFWELEDVPISKAQLGTKNACEILFKSDLKRDIEGRYSVNLPFKSTPKLGDSRSQALRRFFNLEKRLQANPSLKSQYINFMREYMELNHMELIPLKELKKPSNQCFYLPHHGVLREQSTTTKIRVVFDASSRSTNNLSLNDFLHVGPKLQQNLFNILLRFRTFPIAITADIEKMFRQIRLNSDDRDYHRILWRENPEDPLLEYRLLTVTYGTASAPFLAIRTIQQLAEDESSKFPSASSIVFRDFYVDDLISGAYSIQEAKSLVAELSSLLNKGGFKLRKWSSNNKEVLSSLSQEIINDTNSKLLEEDSSNF
ncbi:hypothetical protein LAZ67_19001928 [Cordylochernes scorpioides]|uniref:Peptidase aspartic putative domain-containing protein n=1 Tax=Cordylochernes scorpioides TaxID=51811 RepID=A0ABY6LKN8_9ARAC|nr:hypothetical protein LAZ67_19001928 [Cordylochernes scorpioides]